MIPSYEETISLKIQRLIKIASNRSSNKQPIKLGIDKCK